MRKGDQRRGKRHEIKMLGGHANYNLYSAYLEGCFVGHYLKDNRNPYPPGRRHDEWNRGYSIAYADLEH